jgi:hypothetical protein
MPGRVQVFSVYQRKQSKARTQEWETNIQPSSWYGVYEIKVAKESYGSLLEMVRIPFMVNVPAAMPNLKVVI